MKIYGVHPVEEILAVSPGSVRIVHFDTDSSRRLESVLDRAGHFGIPCEPAAPNKLDGMAEGGNHQGVVADTVDFEYVELDHLLEATADADHAGLLILDEVQDPRNLGAIIRSAAAVDFDGVVIPADRAAPVTPTVVRTSAGCAFRIPVARVTNIARSLEQLKEHGYWTVGARQTDADPVWDIDLAMKTGLVVGGEGEGMRRLVAETCDFYAKIPMASGIESMNVASAASIMVYEARRQWEHAE